MTTHAYFENIQSQIVKELETAKQSIYVAVAWFTDNELLEILCRKATEKLTVSVLILNDEINTSSFGLPFDNLRNAGGQVYLIGSKEEMMHNKFCVIDQNTVITGSYNWTRKAKTNDENITVTKDSSDLAVDFITEYHRLRSKYLGDDTKPVTDLPTLLKRLEILKNTIALQDADDIAYQTAKLQKIAKVKPSQQTEPDINSVLNCIRQKAYGEAVRLIGDILQHYQSLTIWTDPEIGGLQLEIQSLSIQISSLEDELADMEKTIHDYEVRHARELGEIILQILVIKRRHAAQKKKDDPLNEQAKKEYDEAAEDEAQYRGSYEETKKLKLQDLTKDEEEELKRSFRKITKLVHPDVVDKRYEKEATGLFIRAKEAKDNNDLATIREILDYLEKGKPFQLKHQTITKTEVFRKEATHLRQVTVELVKKITALKESDVYQKISEITDWDTYFMKTRETLQAELTRLQTLKYGEFK